MNLIKMTGIEDNDVLRCNIANNTCEGPVISKSDNLYWRRVPIYACEDCFETARRAGIFEDLYKILQLPNPVP